MWLKIMSDMPVGSIILFSLFLAGGYYFWKFDSGQSIKSNIKQLEDDVNQTQNDIARLKTTKANLQDLDKVMNDTANEVEQLYNYIPNELTSSKVLKYLNSLTKQSGVNLEDVKNHGVMTKKKFYEKLKIHMVIRGFFTEILMFLSKLTELKIIITVEKFTIENTHSQNLHGSFLNELKMTMDIYSYRYVTQKQDIL